MKQHGFSVKLGLFVSVFSRVVLLIGNRTRCAGHKAFEGF